MDVWKISPGLSVTYQATFRDGDRNPIAFAGTETLGGTVWQGGTLAPLFTLAPTWATPGEGVVNVPIPGSSTAALAQGTYRVILTVVVNGAAADAFECALEVLYAPGSTPARPAYITGADLRGAATWVDQVLNLDVAQGNFADVCADARDWMDQNILRNVRGTGINVLGWHQVALDGWFNGGARRSSLDNLFIRDQLAAGALMLTPPIRKAMVYWALSLICEQLIGSGGEWPKRHAYYQAKAHYTLAHSVAQLDTNQDGNPEIPINFSATNTLHT